MAETTHKPRYLQIAEGIAGQIQSGQLQIDDKLPSEKELCETWQVSTITVRRSLLELAKQKLIVTKQGVGSFVAQQQKSRRADAQSNQLLGVVIPATADYHNGRVLGAIERLAREMGYSLVVKQSANQPKKETESIEMLLDRDVAGILLSPVSGDSSQTLVSCAKLMAEKMPFVLIDRYLPMLQTPYVIADNQKGGYEVTSHLIKAGHQNIAYLRGVASSASDDRQAGYEKALAQSNLESRIVAVGNADYDMQYAIDKIDAFLNQSGGQYTALFAENDHFARAAYDACRQKGIDIPADIAIAGFDDAPYASLLMPSLTTVFQPDVSIAEAAIRMVVQLIKGIDVQERMAVIAPELIVRESTVMQKNGKKIVGAL